MKEELIIAIVIIFGVISVIGILLGFLYASLIVVALGFITLIVDGFLFRKYIGFHTAWNVFVFGELKKR